MDFIVVSDTHGKYHLLESLLNNHLKLPEKFRSKHLIHLGDGINDIEKCPSSQNFCIHRVRGNCDGFFSSYVESIPKHKVIEFFGYKILIMHGDVFSVKNGDGQAVEYALQIEADILMYGHTHRPLTYTLNKGEQISERVLNKDLTVINPGSLGYDNSFCVVSLEENKILVSHNKI